MFAGLVAPLKRRLGVPVVVSFQGEDLFLEGLPEALGYLEAQLGDGEWFVGGRFTIADIAVGTALTQLHHAGESIDAARFPKLAAFAERIFGRPSFKGLIAEEKASFAAM